MARKRFIDKKNSKTYKVVYRSRQDPLAFEDGEEQHILAQVIPSNSKNKKPKGNSRPVDQDAIEKEEPAALFGIYTDDIEYDYTKHLKEIGLEGDGEQSVFLEATSIKKPKSGGDDLFGMEAISEQTSSKKKNVTFNLPDELTFDISNKMDLNKDAYPVGLQPNMDPKIREVLDVLENVEEYVTDSDNDSFFDKLNDSDLDISDDEEEEEEYDSQDLDNDQDLFKHIQRMKIQNKYDSSEDEFSGSEEDEGESKYSFRSRISAAPKSNFSMTSSVMYRNDNLSLLDDQFDNLEKEYEDSEDSDSEHGKTFTSTRPDFENLIDKFLGTMTNPQVKGPAILDEMRKELAVPPTVPKAGSKKSPAFERVIVRESSTRPLWDAESVFSSMSNLENHPVLIKHKQDGPRNTIKLNKKGFPVVIQADSEESSDSDELESQENKGKKRREENQEIRNGCQEKFCHPIKTQQAPFLFTIPQGRKEENKQIKMGKSKNRSGKKADTAKNSDSVLSSLPIIEDKSGMGEKAENKKSKPTKEKAIKPEVKSVEGSTNDKKTHESSTKVKKPVEASKVKKPVEASTKVKKTVEASTKVKNPVEASTKAENPVEASTKVKKPVEASTKAENPVENSKVKKPVEASTKVKKPVEASTKAKKPVEASTKIKNPVESSTKAKRPLESSAKVEKPLESNPVPAKSEAAEPQQKKKKVQTKKSLATEEKPTSTANVETAGAKRKAEGVAVQSNEKKLRRDMNPGVWIGNLEYEASEQAIKEFFKNVGKVTRCNLPLGRDKKIKGFAYVDFTTHKEVEKALSLSDKYMGSRKVLIKDKFDMSSRTRGTRGRKSKGKSEGRGENGPKYVDTDKPSKLVYVGNLQFSTNKRALIELASNYGHFINVRLPLDSANRAKNFGYALIEYRTLDSAEKAQAGISGTILDGRELRASFSTLVNKSDKPSQNEEITA
ncbi:Protein LTV1-like protein [Smittium mucronatum]|uniref:Protein LTV1-like protein n=1 Tax=Smittium mucronatum TaxID=133383 RepID=A0A1R0GRC4_9FUNG|nr:Protein LTV1-like protein [Smittium mucronatum]